MQYARMYAGRYTVASKRRIVPAHSHDLVTKPKDQELIEPFWYFLLRAEKVALLCITQQPFPKKAGERGGHTGSTATWLRLCQEQLKILNNWLRVASSLTFPKLVRATCACLL